jgi:hypothetical protein
VLLFSIQCSVFAQEAGVDAEMLKLVDSKLDVMMSVIPSVYLAFENTGSVPMKIGSKYDSVEEPSVTLIDDDGNELEVVNKIITVPNTILPGERGFAEIKFWNIPKGAIPVDFKVTFTGVQVRNYPIERIFMDATAAVEYLEPPYNEERGLVATVSNPTEYSYFLDDGYIALFDHEGKLVYFAKFPFRIKKISITPGNSVKIVVQKFRDVQIRSNLKDVDYENSIIKVWFDIKNEN